MELPGKSTPAAPMETAPKTSAVQLAALTRRTCVSRAAQFIELEKILWNKLWGWGTARASSGNARDVSEREVPLVPAQR